MALRRNLESPQIALTRRCNAHSSDPMSSRQGVVMVLARTRLKCEVAGWTLMRLKIWPTLRSIAMAIFAQLR